MTVQTRDMKLLDNLLGLTVTCKGDRNAAARTTGETEDVTRKHKGAEDIEDTPEGSAVLDDNRSPQG